MSESKEPKPISVEEMIEILHREFPEHSADASKHAYQRKEGMKRPEVTYRWSICMGDENNIHAWIASTSFHPARAIEELKEKRTKYRETA